MGNCCVSKQEDDIIEEGESICHPNMDHNDGEKMSLVDNDMNKKAFATENPVAPSSVASSEHDEGYSQETPEMLEARAYVTRKQDFNTERAAMKAAFVSTLEAAVEIPSGNQLLAKKRSHERAAMKAAFVSTLEAAVEIPSGDQLLAKKRGFEKDRAQKKAETKHKFETEAMPSGDALLARKREFNKTREQKKLEFIGSALVAEAMGNASDANAPKTNTWADWANGDLEDEEEGEEYVPPAEQQIKSQKPIKAARRPTGGSAKENSQSLNKPVPVRKHPALLNALAQDDSKAFSPGPEFPPLAGLSNMPTSPRFTKNKAAKKMNADGDPKAKKTLSMKTTKAEGAMDKAGKKRRRRNKSKRAKAVSNENQMQQGN